MKNQKGITLVALVITIIVLLILAGVSISLVIGNNGVLTQASTAVVTNNTASAKQDIKMAVAACYTEYMAEWAKDSSKVIGTYMTAAKIQANLSETATITAVKADGTAASGSDAVAGFKYVYGNGTNNEGRDEIFFKVDDNGTVEFNDEVSTKFINKAS